MIRSFEYRQWIYCGGYMRYLLDERYWLRGWQDIHTAVFDTETELPRFLPKNLYLILMRCDGAHEQNQDEFSEKEKQFFEDIIKSKVIRPAGFAEFLKPEQEYKVYPAPYKKQIHWPITGACNLKCRHSFGF